MSVKWKRILGWFLVIGTTSPIWVPMLYLFIEALIDQWIFLCVMIVAGALIYIGYKLINSK